MTKRAEPPVSNELKTFRVHFDLDGSGYRDVQAFDEDDAREQVQGDRIDHDDCERANFSSISVDDVEELKPKTEQTKKKRQSANGSAGSTSTAT